MHILCSDQMHPQSLPSNSSSICPPPFSHPSSHALFNPLSTLKVACIYVDRGPSTGAMYPRNVTLLPGSSLLPVSHYLGVEPHDFPVHAGTWGGLLLGQFCTWSRSHFLSSPGSTVSLSMSITPGSYHLLTPSSVTISEACGEGV